ncbi:reverse transcriptase family protein [Xanthomonas arboricola]
MLGINPGLVWSFEHRSAKHYRRFTIPKGAGQERVIIAPRVALKIVQKWVSVQLQRAYAAPQHVFGFVPGRSHIDAAKQHRLAEWTYSVDIADFFPSTPLRTVTAVFNRLGYGDEVASMLASLSCYQGFLAQGAPTSPVISNLALHEVDRRLIDISRSFDVRVSRYADDIVFSGQNGFPEELVDEVNEIFIDTPWTISQGKTELNRLPRRLKVHGLLVHGAQARLTKGYRNKLRAYAHLIKNGLIQEGHKLRVKGHLRYGEQVKEAAD